MQRRPRQANKKRPSFILFTADRGDYPGEHRMLFKDTEQHDSLSHVPFIWVGPKGAKGERSQEIAQMPDIGTTILEHARVEAPVGKQGVALSLAGGQGREAAHIQFETQRTQEALCTLPCVHTTIHDRWRPSISLGKCPNERIDLVDDPGERTNRWDSAAHADIRSRLIEGLAELDIAVVNRVPLPTAQPSPAPALSPTECSSAASDS